MRITRRPSGGRGEYEISEDSPEGLTPASLFGQRLVLEIATGWVIDTDCELRHQGGKRRIRLLHPESKRYMHPHLQLAAALLMPAPVRELRVFGTGSPAMRKGRYAIEHILLNRVRLSRKRNAVRLWIDEVVVRNASIQHEELGFRRRVAEVREVWKRSNDFPAPIQVLLDQHQTMARAGGPLLRQTQSLVTELQAAVSQHSDEIGVFYDVSCDVLPALLDALEMELPAEPPPPLNEVPQEELEIRRRRAREWRQWAARRGPTSARFRRAVQRAYDYTCVVCGARLPPTEVNRKPGVDSAHILPWAKYELDEEANGLCLCKLHHWAFDEGLIEVYYEDSKYGVRLGPGVDQLASLPGGFGLQFVASYVGEIPASRLPSNPKHRPHPQALQLLRQETSD